MSHIANKSCICYWYRPRSVLRSSCIGNVYTERQPDNCSKVMEYKGIQRYTITGSYCRSRGRNDKFSKHIGSA